MVGGRRTAVQDVPANGYRTVPLSDPSPSQLRTGPGGVIETPFYRATLDLRRGVLAGLGCAARPDTAARLTE